MRRSDRYCQQKRDRCVTSSDCTLFQEVKISLSSEIIVVSCTVTDGFPYIIADTVIAS